MRLGIELRLPFDNGLLEAAVDEARVAEELGFDLVWIDAAAAGQPAHTSLAMAAALAPHLRSIAVGAVLHLGVDHPIYSVEEAAMVDLLLGGRLITCLRPAPGAEDRFAEAVDVFLAGLAPRPFHHDGPMWKVPANLADNVFNIEQRLRVTPSTAQIEPVVWVAGDAAVATTRGLAYVADGATDGAGSWPQIDSELGRRALRLRRPARWPLDEAAGAGDVDIHELADELSAAQRAWGLDTAILALPSGDRHAIMDRIAHDVRPRVQLDRLPPGLSDYWDGRMAARLTRSTHTGGDDG